MLGEAADKSSRLTLSELSQMGSGFPYRDGTKVDRCLLKGDDRFSFTVPLPVPTGVQPHT